MKNWTRSKKVWGVALLAGALLAPGLNSCKKGENDPGLSFRSRDARLSADWQLDNIEYEEVTNENFTITYNDVDCGSDATGSTSKNYSISGETFSQSAQRSQDADPYYDDKNGYGSTDFETLDMSIAISKEGTYDVTIEYSISESDYYGSGNQDPNQKTFEGTYEETGLEWSWADDGDRKAKVRFEDFPMIGVNVNYSDIDPDPTVDDYESYIGGVWINTRDKEFYIDQLRHKELTLMETGEESSDDTDVEEYEGMDGNGDPVDCVRTMNSTETVETSLTLDFTSEGDNIKE